jgi:hypothetical protein
MAGRYDRFPIPIATISGPAAPLRDGIQGVSPKQLSAKTCEGPDPGEVSGIGANAKSRPGRVSVEQADSSAALQAQGAPSGQLR